VDAVSRQQDPPDHQDLTVNQATTELLDHPEKTDHPEPLLHLNANNTADVKNVDRPKLDNQENPDQKVCPERLAHQAELPTEVYADRQDHQDQLVHPVWLDIQEMLDNQERQAPSEPSPESKARPVPLDHLDHADPQEVPAEMEIQESQAVKVHQEMLEPRGRVENQVAKDSQEHKAIRVQAGNAVIAAPHAPPPDISFNEERPARCRVSLSNLPFFLIFLFVFDSRFSENVVRAKTKIL